MSSSLPYRKFDEFLELRESKEIKVYLNDGTHEKFTITPSSTSVQICSQLLGDKYGGRLDWSIVEVWREEGIERTLEYHENLLKVYRKMENGNKDGNRVFMFRLADKMFDMYIYPHAYSFLYKSYELDKKAEDKIIQKVLNGDMDPLHYNQVWIYDSQKTDPMWKQTILFLKNKKLYFASSYRSLITPIKNADNGCLFNSLVLLEPVILL